MRLDLPGPEATVAFAQALAPMLDAGDVLALEGPIGAGKTHFARALILARLAEYGVAEDVPSPTFTLVQIYHAGDLEIWHADLYRLTHPDEAAELGLTEAFETALCLVEWPERLGADLPPDALHLQLEPGESPGARCATVRGGGDWAVRLAGQALKPWVGENV
jgi:tRNA threonylcarbamoyladenosine biosynthesis protein TsaE